MTLFSYQSKIVLIAVTALFFMPVCAAAEEQEKPYLFLGNHDIPPMIYVENGQPVGLVIDLVQQLAASTDLSVDVRAMDWQEAQSLVREGDADALMQINWNEERDKFYDFSDTLLESRFSIFRREGKVEIQTINSLAGLTVGVEAKGYPIQLLKRYPKINIQIIPSWKVGFQRINDGSLDAIIVDRWVGEFVLYKNELKGIIAVDQPVGVSYSTIAVKKGNKQLLDRINEAL